MYPLRVVFRWARAAGFDGVELVVNPEAIARGGRAARRLAEAEGTEILSVHPTIVPIPGWRDRHDGLERTIRLAQASGAGLVITHTPRSTSLEEGKGLRFRQQIELWQTKLAGSGLRLAIENKAIRHPRDRGYALTPLDRLRDFADRYDLDLVLDTSHAGTANADLVRARQTFHGRLANVHLSDTGGSVPLAANRTVRKVLEQHRFPGDGDLSLANLMADLANCGYTGPVTLEISPIAMDIWWPPSVRRRLTEAITWMKQATSSRSLVTG